MASTQSPQAACSHLSPSTRPWASSSNRSSSMQNGASSSIKLENSSTSRSSSPSPQSWRTQDADNLRLRRKISALGDTVDRLESARGSSKRSRTDSPYQPGRGVRRVADLYHDLTELLSKAGKHAAMTSLDATELVEIDRIDFVGLTEEEIEEERKDRRRCQMAVQILNKLIPGFQDKCNASDDLTSFLSPLQTGANGARSDDTGKLKVAIAEWLNTRKSRHHNSSGDGDDSKTDDSNRNHNTPFLSPKGKEERGIANDITGRLICPIDYDWDDPDVRAKLRNGEPNFDVASSFFIRCLYENENGNPNSPEDGFLKGPLLVRAFRLFFTSPSSAYEEDEVSKVTSRRRDVASTLRLNGQVTPRAIAYTATQLAFSLNTSRDWRHEHAGFHYPSFYNFIVGYFEDVEDDISKEANTELLRWWNRKLFPPTTTKTAVSTSRAASASSWKRLQESRARCARMVLAGNSQQQHAAPSYAKRENMD